MRFDGPGNTHSKKYYRCTNHGENRTTHRHATATHWAWDAFDRRSNLTPPNPASPKQTSKILPTIAMSLTSADAVETIEVALSLRVMIQRKSVVCMGEFNVCMQLTYLTGITVSKEHSPPARGNRWRENFEKNARI